MAAFLISAGVIFLNVMGTVNGACSYYQVNNMSFPTDTCVNTSKINGKITSSGFYCYNGLFRTSVYQYTFNGAHCKGSPIQTHITNCVAPTCNCAVGNSPSQCTLGRYSYDTQYCPKSQHFDEQNLTIITNQCINGKGYVAKDGRLVYEQFSDYTCQRLQVTHSTCFVYDYDESDTDTDSDTDSNINYVTTQSPHKYVDNEANFRFGVNRIITLVAACVIACSLCCGLCCIASKVRRLKQKNQVAEIDEVLLGEAELNEEGIQSEFVDEEQQSEQIIIPGQNHEEIEINQVEIVAKENGSNDDDDEDIPSAAFSPVAAGVNGNEEEVELSFEISEGNEGMMDEDQQSSESSKEDSSISNLSALDI